MTRLVLVPIANGTEEIEAITIIDVLRRAECEVTVASCHEHTLVTGSRNIQINTDTVITECTEQNWDLIALPGGVTGAENLRESSHLTEILKAQKREHRWIAAICAAPAVVLSHHNLINNAKATCYPTFLSAIPRPEEDPKKTVVCDESEKIITSQGPGTAFEFALELVSLLKGEGTATALAKTMQAHWWPGKR